MPLASGNRLGPYRLVSLIGKGGMGAVWRAVREGGDFEQEVAIKVVHEGLASDLVDRFRRERQILAQLNHPHIARILDGGETEGTPYLVMEFIDGQPLIAYAEQQKLDLRERLKLFRLVCDAVQFAHQRLVVHRDLKPANILVTRDGTPKLLDFGIAKILASGETESAYTQTLTGFLAMTPDYASPEQVRGEEVSTATDIYSLGAILYELLSKQRPHDLTKYDALELVHKICDTETIAPSKHDSPNLRGDLDTIVLKAMQKDPSRRYVSADQFSEDIRRFLEGLPVLARPDTIRYRTVKYAKRHKWGVAAVGAIILALVVGLLAAERQARIASERFDMVRGLANKFVFEVHDEVARVDGTTKARQLLVSTGLQYLDKLSVSAGTDRVLLEDLIRAYTRIGDVQGRTGGPNLGQLDAATVSYQKALDLAERLYRKDPSKYAFTLATAETSLAQNLWSREKDDESLKHLERSVQLAHEAETRDPNGEKIQELLATNEFTLGTRYYGQVRMREALREYDASEQRRSQIAAKNPTQQNRLAWVNTAQSLSRTKQLFGELDSSGSLLDRARKTMEEELAGNPDDPRILRTASVLYQHLHALNHAETRPCLDNAEEAWKWRQKSSLITARLTAKDANNADAKDLRSIDDVGSGYILSLLGRAKEAAPLLEQGLTLTRELKAAAGAVNYYDTRESTLLRWLAHAYSQLGRQDAARKLAQEAVESSERDWRSDPEAAPGQLFLMNAYRMKAFVEIAARDFKSARESLDRGAEISRKWQASPQHEVFLATALSNYYQSYAELGRAEGRPDDQRAWSEKIATMWRAWPEQNGYTRMRQSNPTVRYPW